MSTIGVKYHDEDIHNIIRKPIPPIVKSARHKSKKTFLDDETSKQKKFNGHQTFGLAHYEAPEAKDFLRKKKLTPCTQSEPADRNELICQRYCKASQIPTRFFKTRKQETKNFIKENIKKTKTIKPKIIVPRRVETPRGTTKDLAHLLQMIKIRESEEYAKLPKYLIQRNKREERERKKRELEMKALAEHRAKMGIGLMGMGENVYMIDQETRQKILDGLKENWNELSKHFLKLPVMLDTWPKIKRKILLEKEIDQLEKDIRLVESHPYIYLEKQNGRYYVEENEKPTQNKIEKEQETEVKNEERDEEKDKEEEDEEKKREMEKQKNQKEYVEEFGEEKKEEDEEIKILNY